MEEEEYQIYNIERPESVLLTYYILQSLMVGPFLIFLLPYLYFRYHTMRYRFDDKGVSMSWGILFKHEINLSYDRIQDIHLTSNVVQRWMGLAHIHIQTASGSSAAEMKIEGIKDFEAIRNFLYGRMKGYNETAKRPPAGPGADVAGAVTSPALQATLIELTEEIRLTRQALESMGREE